MTADELAAVAQRLIAANMHIEIGRPGGFK